jgi:hypothetical protein
MALEHFNDMRPGAGILAEQHFRRSFARHLVIAVGVLI